MKPVKKPQVHPGNQFSELVAAALLLLLF